MAVERDRIQQEKEELLALRQTVSVQEKALEAGREKLEAVIAKLEAKQSEYVQERENSAEKLAKMYEAMKPAQAAPIMSALDLEIILDIMGPHEGTPRSQDPVLHGRRIGCAGQYAHEPAGGRIVEMLMNLAAPAAKTPAAGLGSNAQVSGPAEGADAGSESAAGLSFPSLLIQRQQATVSKAAKEEGSGEAPPSSDAKDAVAAQLAGLMAIATARIDTPAAAEAKASLTNPNAAPNSSSNSANTDGKDAVNGQSVTKRARRP